MSRFMDYMISPHPIRIVQLKVDRSKLMLPSLIITQLGHLPGRTLYRNKTYFTQWAMVYISGGRGTYQVNDQPPQIVEAGSLFFFFPNTEFQYGPDPDEYWDEYYFTLDGDRIQEWVKSGMIRPGTVLKVGIDDVQLNKIERVFMLMESGIPANYDRAALLVESVLFEFTIKAKGMEESTKAGQIQRLMDDISNSLFQPISTVQIAKRHHMSHSTLRRIVSEYSGYPLNEYIHRLKVAEAKKILLNTEATVKEISDALGYKDVFYFSRLFKKYVGISPLIFRKNSSV